MTKRQSCPRPGLRCADSVPCVRHEQMAAWAATPEGKARIRAAVVAYVRAWDAPPRVDPPAPPPPPEQRELFS